jgi:hypothetical protein
LSFEILLPQKDEQSQISVFSAILGTLSSFVRDSLDEAIKTLRCFIGGRERFWVRLYSNKQFDCWSIKKGGDKIRIKKKEIP